MTRAFPQLNPDVLSRRVGDDVVLVHLRTNRIYSLNPTAARLWELGARGASLDEAFARLKEEFEVSDETLREETEALIAMLEREGLVVQGAAEQSDEP